LPRHVARKRSTLEMLRIVHHKGRCATKPRAWPVTEDDRAEFEQTRAEHNDQTLAFIRTEISTGNTFAELAETEYAMGNRKHGMKVQVDAEKAYTTAERWLREATANGLATAELVAELSELRTRLDTLRPRIVEGEGRLDPR
jgi:hypothetical protein